MVCFHQLTFQDAVYMTLFSYSSDLLYHVASNVYQLFSFLINKAYSFFKTCFYPTVPEEAEKIEEEETTFEGLLKEEDPRSIDYGPMPRPGSYTYSSTDSPSLNNQYSSSVSQFLDAVITAYRAARQNLTHGIQKPHICILGMGPTGLMAGLRAYAQGASITLIDKRIAYTRENVLRLAQDFLLPPLDPDDSNAFPHNLSDTLFFTQEKDRSWTTSVLGSLMQLAVNTPNTDTVFAAEQTPFFHTISTNKLEDLLYYLLSKLQETDKEHITLCRGHEVHAIHAEAGNVYVKKQGSNQPIKVQANWIVNATGAHGRLVDGSPIVDVMFPQTNEHSYTPTSSHAPYLATTLHVHNASRSHGTIVRATNNQLPVAFTDGASTYLEHHPEHSGAITTRISEYKNQNNAMRLTNTLAAQRVFYNYASQASYASNPSLTHNPGTNRAAINLDLACSHQGVLNDLQYIQREFGWTRNRLPLVRQLNSNTTIYLGMELPAQLFNELVSEQPAPEEKKTRFTGWVKTALRQFFPQELLDRLSIRQGSAFTLQMQTCNKIMHKYAHTNTHVFNLGDALATPHFLTGSGLESAAISVHHWIEYMQEGNQERFVQQIKDNVQARARNKVSDGLGNLRMFAPMPTQPAAPTVSASVFASY